MIKQKQLLTLLGAGALLMAMLGATSGTALATAANTQYWAGNGVVDGQATVNCTDADPGTMLWIWTGTGTNVNISVDGEVVAGVQKGNGAYQFTTGWHDVADLTTGVGGNVFVTYDGAADGNAVLTLSHVCPGETTTTTTTDTFTSTEASTTDTDTTTTTTDTFTGSVSDTTDSQPPTDTIGSTGSGQQSGGMWLLIAGLGMLLGSVIVLAPAKTRK